MSAPPGRAVAASRRCRRGKPVRRPCHACRPPAPPLSRAYPYIPLCTRYHYSVRRREGGGRHRVQATSIPLLLIAAGTVGFLHSILPDHWVPLAVVARTQRWTPIHSPSPSLLPTI